MLAFGAIIIVVLILVLVISPPFAKNVSEKYEPTTILDADNLKLVQTMANIMYPIGAIIISTNNESPMYWNIAFEGMVWEQVSTTNYALKTTLTNGGSYEGTAGTFTNSFKTEKHSLEESEFPPHTHKCTAIGESEDTHIHDVKGYYTFNAPSEYLTGMNETAGEVMKRLITKKYGDIDTEYDWSDWGKNDDGEYITDADENECNTKNCYFERAFTIINCNNTGNDEDLKMICLIHYLVGYNNTLLNTNLKELLENVISKYGIDTDEYKYAVAILSWYVHDVGIDHDATSTSDTTVDTIKYDNFNIYLVSESITSSHYHSVEVSPTGTGEGHTHTIELPYHTFYVYKRTA